MDEQTALEGSIKKWERIVDGSGADHGGADCALCQSNPECIDCIAIHVCNYAYWYWFEHHFYEHDGNMPRVVKCDECLKLATAVLNELKSLRRD